MVASCKLHWLNCSTALVSWQWLAQCIQQLLLKEPVHKLVDTPWLLNKMQALPGHAANLSKLLFLDQWFEDGWLLGRGSACQ